MPTGTLFIILRVAWLGVCAGVYVPCVCAHVRVRVCMHSVNVISLTWRESDHKQRCRNNAMTTLPTISPFIRVAPSLKPSYVLRFVQWSHYDSVCFVLSPASIENRESLWTGWSRLLACPKSEVRSSVVGRLDAFPYCNPIANLSR